jgi:hypothetical protein
VPGSLSSVTIAETTHPPRKLQVTVAHMRKAVEFLNLLSFFTLAMTR